MGICDECKEKQMNRIVLALLVWLGCIVFLVAAINISEIADEGFISKQTEEKYIRNIGRFTIEGGGDRWLYVRSDTLTSIFENHSAPINLFSKYSIHRVGMIRRGSRLHHLVDSVITNSPDPNNKYK